MDINWLATLVATVSTFALGFVWYNPNTFGKAWQKASGISDEQMSDTSGMGKIFGTSFVFALIMTLTATYFLRGVSEMTTGLRVGLYLGLGIATMSIGINAMYERKNFTYIVINGGYQIVSLIIISAIITAWR